MIQRMRRKISGGGFVSLLHRKRPSRAHADRWISQAPEADLYLFA